MLYRITTEHKNLSSILALCDKVLPGYTVIHTDGRWDGQSEESLILEYDNLGDYAKAPGISQKTINHQTRLIVKALAKSILTTNDQQAVLIQEIPCISYLVEDK